MDCCRGDRTEGATIPPPDAFCEPVIKYRNVASNQRLDARAIGNGVGGQSIRPADVDDWSIEPRSVPN